VDEATSKLLLGASILNDRSFFRNIDSIQELANIFVSYFANPLDGCR
jgi:hypothetical protein